MFPIRTLPRVAAGLALFAAANFSHAAYAPSASTGTASSITATAATLSGTVSANGSTTTISFEVAQTAASVTQIAATPPSISSWTRNKSVSATASGLACASTYYYRVRAANSAGTRFGTARSFTTAACGTTPQPVAPTATTAAATGLAATQATLNGSATAGSAAATLTFEYGTTTAYGASLAATPGSIAAGTGSTAMASTLQGLACGTTYHYRARAASSVGSAMGANRSFATAACTTPPATVAPTATTGAAAAIAATQATLSGTATAGSATAILTFEYGPTTAYGASLAATPGSIAASTGSTAMTATLQGLACGTTYHFRARAASSVGTATGGNQSFATAACTPPPQSLSCTDAKVHCVSPTAGANQEFSNIQAAVNSAVAGDTVLVFDGNYAGFVVTRSGSASAPITVRAQGASAVVDRASSAGEGIRVSNASYVAIEGFTVTGIAGYGLAARGATATSPMHGVVFRDNTVRNSGSTNIYASQVTNSLIEGNTTSGAGEHGIYLANAGSDNTTIRGNVVYDNAVAGMHLNGDASIGGDGVITGAVIDGNVVYANATIGINFDGVQASTIVNNVVYANGRHGIRAYVIDGAAGPRNLLIVNNTVVAAGSNTCVKITEDLGGHTLFNNILAAEGSGGTIVVGNSAVASDRNTFVNAGFSLNGGSTMLSLTQWRAQGDDASSLTSTQAALFLAPASRDYRLRAGSPAANAGTPSFNGRGAAAADILEVARPQGTAHDHGAFESF